MHLTGAKNNPNSFLLLTTMQNLDELKISPKSVVDGLFAVFSSLFYLLYTMQGVIKDTTVPLVYSSMRSETEKNEELFAALKSLNAKLDPYEVSIDFKIAAIEVVKSSFSNANLKDTFLKFPLEKWRKLLGLLKKTKRAETYAFFLSLSKIWQNPKR